MLPKIYLFSIRDPIAWESLGRIYNRMVSQTTSATASGFRFRKILRGRLAFQATSRALAHPNAQLVQKSRIQGTETTHEKVWPERTRCFPRESH
jgi:hypothetical protein